MASRWSAYARDLRKVLGMDTPKTEVGAAGRCAEMTARGICNRIAKFLTPAGGKVCGIHRRFIDDYHARLGHEGRCVPLSDEEKSQ